MCPYQFHSLHFHTTHTAFTTSASWVSEASARTGDGLYV